MIIVALLPEILERKSGTFTIDSTSPLPMPYDKNAIRKKDTKSSSGYFISIHEFAFFVKIKNGGL